MYETMNRIIPDQMDIVFVSVAFWFSFDLLSVLFLVI